MVLLAKGDFARVTRYFRHFRRFPGSEEPSNLFMWMECNIIFFADVHQNHLFSAGDKIRFPERPFDNPEIRFEIIWQRTVQETFARGICVSLFRHGWNIVVRLSSTVHGCCRLSLYSPRAGSLPRALLTLCSLLITQIALRSLWD